MSVIAIYLLLKLGFYIFRKIQELFFGEKAIHDTIAMASAADVAAPPGADTGRRAA